MDRSDDRPACTLCQGVCNWACFAKQDPHVAFQEGATAVETLAGYLLDCSPPADIIPEIPESGVDV